MTQLDSNRFIVSQSSDERLAFEDFTDKLIAKSQQTQETSPISFSLSSLVDREDVDFLRFVFLFMDMILLLYRLSWTYVSYHKHIRRTDPVHGVTASTSQGHTVSAKSDTTKKHEAENHVLVEHLVYKDNLQMTDGNNCQCPSDTTITKLRDYTALQQLDSQVVGAEQSENLIPTGVAKFADVQTVTEKLFESALLPRTIICLLVLVLTYLVLRSVLTLMNVDFLLRLNAFTMYGSSLLTRISLTNDYLRQEAQHFNNVTLHTYREHMLMELLNLRSFLEYFHLGQSFILSFCSVI